MPCSPWVVCAPLKHDHHLQHLALWLPLLLLLLPAGPSASAAVS